MNGESIDPSRSREVEKVRQNTTSKTEIEQDVENKLFSFVVNVIVNLFSNAIVIESGSRHNQPA